VDLPAYRVKPGDEIAIAEGSRNLTFIRENLEAMKGRKVGPWLSLDVEGMKGKFLRLPDREDLALPVNEQLVIEFYSR
jgi:small subunit ribosomal protein S4